MWLRSFLWGYLGFCAWFAVLIGVVQIASEAYSIVSDRMFVWTAEEVRTKVIRSEIDVGSHGTMYRPTFGLGDPADSRIEYTGNSWYYPELHERGDVVKGYYQPKTGIIVSEEMLRRKARFRGPQVIGGMVFLGAGAAFLMWRKRKRQSSA